MADSQAVSAVIISRNSANYLKSCLKALYGQSRIPDEVILVDRGSHDQTADLVRLDFPSVRILQSKRDPGIARAINEGIRRTKGDFVLIIYAEVQLDRAYVTQTLEGLLASGWKVGSASGKVYKMFRGPGVLDSAGISFDAASGFPAKRGEGEQGKDAFENRELVFGAAQYAALYRRKTIRDLTLNGAFLDEDPLFDEYDLPWRAQLRGWKSLYVPAAVAKADIKDHPVLPLMKAVRKAAGKYLEMYKNLTASDVQDNVCRLLLSEFLRHARNVFLSPHLLLSLPVTAMMLPAIRKSRQVVRKSRRVRDARLDSPGFAS